MHIGRASDVSPVSVPHVIARKHKPPVPPPTAVQNIARPRKGKAAAPPGSANGGDEYTVVVPSDDPVSVMNHAGSKPSLTVNMRPLADRSKAKSLQYHSLFATACASINFVSQPMLHRLRRHSMNTSRQRQ